MLIPLKGNLVAITNRNIQYLTEEEINALTKTWIDYYDSREKKARRKARGQYFLTFLVLRYTGARHGEVRLIDDSTDISFRECEIRLKTLKQKRNIQRVVPVPPEVIAEIARYLAEYPSMKGKIFKLDVTNFKKKFHELALKAGISREKSHPHVLRHTRAMELLRSGIPITAVQSFLGHASLNSTSVYLRFSNMEVKQMMKEKGLI